MPFYHEHVKHRCVTNYSPSQPFGISSVYWFGAITQAVYKKAFAA